MGRLHRHSHKYTQSETHRWAPVTSLFTVSSFTAEGMESAFSFKATSCTQNEAQGQELSYLSLCEGWRIDDHTIIQCLMAMLTGVYHTHGPLFSFTQPFLIQQQQNKTHPHDSIHFSGIQRPGGFLHPQDKALMSICLQNTCFTHIQCHPLTIVSLKSRL